MVGHLRKDEKACLAYAEELAAQARQAEEGRPKATSLDLGTIRGVPGFDLSMLTGDTDLALAETVSQFFDRAKEKGINLASETVGEYLNPADLVGTVGVNLNSHIPEALKWLRRGKSDAGDLMLVFSDIASEKIDQRGAQEKIRDIFGAEYVRAEGVARTEMAWAHEEAAMAAFIHSGVEALVWDFGGGPCTSGVCFRLHGRIVDTESFELGGVGFGAYSDPDIDARAAEGGDFTGHIMQPPAHPNCTCAVLPAGLEDFLDPEATPVDSGLGDVISTDFDAAPQTLGDVFANNPDWRADSKALALEDWIDDAGVSDDTLKSVIRDELREQLIQDVRFQEFADSTLRALRDEMLARPAYSDAKQLLESFMLRSYRTKSEMDNTVPALLQLLGPDDITDEGFALWRGVMGDYMAQTTLSRWASSSMFPWSQNVQSAALRLMQNRFGDMDLGAFQLDYSERHFLDLLKQEFLMAGQQPSALIDAAFGHVNTEDVFDSLAEAMYDHTQRTLAAEGFERVVIQRGMALETVTDLTDAGIRVTPSNAQLRDLIESYADAHNTATADGWDSNPDIIEDYLGDGNSFSTIMEFLSGEEASEFRLRPLSSTASEPTNFTASGFAEGDVPVFMSASVSRERVFSTARTGIGCRSEHEVVVLGGPGDWSISANDVAYGFDDYRGEWVGGADPNELYSLALQEGLLYDGDGNPIT